MEVKAIRAYLAKCEHTRTYLINMSVGICVFLLAFGIAKFVSAADTPAADAAAAAEDLTSEQLPTALSERSANRILALANNMSEKMSAAIKRHEQITKRIEQYIATIEAQGMVVSTSTKERVVASQTELAIAKRNVDTELDALIDATVFSEAPVQNWPQARAKYAQTADSIRNAFSTLSTAVADLRTTVVP